MENINVKALTRLTGINENTLRGWERRYKAVEPLRGEDGRRLYSAKDVERVKLLWTLVQNGHQIGLIAKLPTIKLKKLLAETAPLIKEKEEVKVVEPIEVYQDSIIRALEAFDLEKLFLILQRAKFSVSPKEIILNLLRPLMQKVGMLVHENKLSIAQEHVLSSLLRDYLGTLYQSLSPYEFSSRTHAKSIILTTREGDMHEFGILLSAILCNLYRLKTYYLGPNMPIKDLADACVHFKVDYIVLALTELPADREIISSINFIRKLDQLLPQRVTFCLGGKSFDLTKLETKREMIFFQSFEELDQFFEGIS
jgi:MerR family transcriptional regulator, light-induced transcriptional regulator